MSFCSSNSGQNQIVLVSYFKIFHLNYNQNIPRGDDLFNKFSTSFYIFDTFNSCHFPIKMIDNAINITANLMKLSSESLKIFNGCMRTSVL